MGIMFGLESILDQFQYWKSERKLHETYQDDEDDKLNEKREKKIQEK